MKFIKTLHRPNTFDVWETTEESKENQITIIRAFGDEPQTLILIKDCDSDECTSTTEEDMRLMYKCGGFDCLTKHIPEAILKHLDSIK